MLRTVLVDAAPTRSRGRYIKGGEHIAAERNVCEASASFKGVPGSAQSPGGPGELAAAFRDAHKGGQYSDRVQQEEV